jgi:hypothetical protein
MATWLRGGCGVVETKPERLRRRLRALRPWWRTILRAALFAGPTLLLIPLGIAWLWERGWTAWWLMAWTVGVFLAVWASGLWKPDLPPISLKGSRQGASAGELEARARIAKIVESAKSSDIADADAARDLSEKVAHEVASAFHPGEEAPTLRVTLPELLLVTERTAHDIRQRLLADFPILRDVRFDILDSGAGLLVWADRAMTSYRVGRFLWNPVNALIQEAQRAGTNIAGRGMAGYARRRVAQILVAEVGEAAIRLYSGSARLDARELEEASRLDVDSGSGEAPEKTRECLRAAVVGQVNAGKSSLVNALSGEARALAGNVIHTGLALEFPIDHPTHGSLVVTDTRGLAAGEPPDVETFVAADLLLWPVALHRADRAADMQALTALRAWSAKNPARSIPPIVFVGTHLDRLDPVTEWSPPYDLVGGKRPKEVAFAAALAAAKTDLAWPEARWTVAMLGSGIQTWNVDAVRGAIADARPAAETSRNLRLRATRGSLARVSDAARALRGAGRVIIGEVTRGIPPASRK